MKYKVALLKGGINSEREVSLNTAKACSYALKEIGHNVFEIDIKDNLLEKLSKIDAEICFNALHGSIGEDGSIQGLLNYLKLPYTHSGVVASAIAMDKLATRQMLYDTDIVFPRTIELKIDNEVIPQNYKGSYVVKPKAGGSSVGVKIIKNKGDEKLLSSLWDNTEDLICEEYIDGKELTVGILDGVALCITEIKTKGKSFYNYTSKYSPGASKHLIPAKIPIKIQNIALEWAELAFKKLGCRGVARVDFRYDPKSSNLAMLELNTQPGMTDTSLIPEQAEYCGIQFNRLISKLLEMATFD